MSKLVLTKLARLTNTATQVNLKKLEHFNLPQAPSAHGRLHQDLGKLSSRHKCGSGKRPDIMLARFFSSSSGGSEGSGSSSADKSTSSKKSSKKEDAPAGSSDKKVTKVLKKSKLNEKGVEQLRKVVSGIQEACEKLKANPKPEEKTTDMNLAPKKPEEKEKEKKEGIVTSEKKEGIVMSEKKKVDREDATPAIIGAAATTSTQTPTPTDIPTSRPSSRKRDKFRMEELNDEDRQRRVMFATKLLLIIEDEPEILDNILWTDECHFNLPKLDSIIKKPAVSESELLPQIAWCGITSRGTVGPYFFNSHVTDKSYLKMLKTYLIPELECKGYDLKNLWFQQDGAPWHRSKIVLDYLKSVFDYRILSLGTKFIWPPRSQDLTPMDYFFWDYMKLLLNFKHSKYDLQFRKEFRDIMAKEVVGASRKILQGAIYQVPERLELCLNCNGGRFQHLMVSPGKKEKEAKEVSKSKEEAKEDSIITSIANAIPLSNEEVEKVKIATKSAVPPSRFSISTSSNSKPQAPASSSVPSKAQTKPKSTPSPASPKPKIKASANLPPTSPKPKLSPSPPKPTPVPISPKPKTTPIQVGKITTPQSGPALRSSKPHTIPKPTPPPPKSCKAPIQAVRLTTSKAQPKASTPQAKKASQSTPASTTPHPPKAGKTKTAASKSKTSPPPIAVPNPQRLELNKREDQKKTTVVAPPPQAQPPPTVELISCVNTTIADAAISNKMSEDLFNHNYNFIKKDKEAEAE